MSGVVDVSLVRLLLFSLLLILPCAALWRWKLFELSRGLVFSVLRMAVQLLLVGLYLKYLFEFNNPWVNAGWLLVMVSVASASVIRQAGLRLSRLFISTQISLLLVMTLSCLAFLVILIQPDSLMDARYLIPVAGMLLGNCLQGNIRALDQFYNELRTNEAAYLSDLLLGATVKEATAGIFRKSVRSALSPMVGSMATLGIVSLPGMMTGQILGGALPLTAAKYQIAITLAIFIAMTFAIALNLRLSLRQAFTPSGILDKRIFL